jgi:PTS system nitrogen regulatory IIA component
MKLTVRDVARMFDASEAAVERWIRHDDLPHHRVHGQFRFHRAELLEWANQHGIRLGGDAPISSPSSLRGGRPPRFAEALAAGGIHHSVPATDRESLLRAVIDRMPIAEEMDKDLLFEVLLAREKSGSTGVGDGIAIPHVRNPVVLQVDEPAVTLCFLDHPVDFGAIDDKPVHTVFSIVAPTIRVHLFILARLAAALHDEGFRHAVTSRAPAEEILERARDAEAKLTSSLPEETVSFTDNDDGERST